MHTLAIIASAWRSNIPGLIVCAVLFFIYAVFGGLRRPGTLAWFSSAEILLATLVCSPLDLLGRDYLLTAEALEQMLILLVASYLLLLGTSDRLVRRLHLDRLRLNYYVAWMTGMGVLAIWHIPRVLNASVSSPVGRGLEYAILLIAGAIFWWPIHSPLREQRIPLVPRSLFYLAAATVWCSLLGLALAFGRPTGHYLRADPLHINDSLVNDWSFTPASDQETAGLLFWIGAAAILLSEVMLVYYRWYVSPEVRNEFASSVKARGA